MSVHSLCLIQSHSLSLWHSRLRWTGEALRSLNQWCLFHYSAEPHKMCKEVQTPLQEGRISPALSQAAAVNSGRRVDLPNGCQHLHGAASARSLSCLWWRDHSFAHVLGCPLLLWTKQTSCSRKQVSYSPADSSSKWWEWARSFLAPAWTTYGNRGWAYRVCFKAVLLREEFAMNDTEI